MKFPVRDPIQGDIRVSERDRRDVSRVVDVLMWVSQWRHLLVALLLLPVQALAVAPEVSPPDFGKYEPNSLTLGVGVGVVKFDSKVKVVDKESGGRRFLDLEGNLDLPEEDTVNVFYGAYAFNEKHSLVFSYFAINRESDLINFSRNYDDIVLLDVSLTVEDKSRFYYGGYGYNLFRDDRSSVTLVAGLNAIDLKLVATAEGALTVDGETAEVVEVAEADVLAPLPLLGLNFAFSFTPEWSIATRISIVDGSYEGVEATITQASINSMYRISQHTGILLGVTHFDASVEVDDDDDITNVSYGYGGLFLGLHLGF